LKLKKKCEICGSTEFKINSEKFCSQECIRTYGYQQSIKNRITCPVCNKKFAKTGFQAHLQTHSTHYHCEYCNKEVFEKYGSGRFCSQKCANGFSVTNSGTGRRPRSKSKIEIEIKNNKMTQEEVIKLAWDRMNPDFIEKGLLYNLRKPEIIDKIFKYDSHVAVLYCYYEDNLNFVMRFAYYRDELQLKKYVAENNNIVLDMEMPNYIKNAFKNYQDLGDDIDYGIFSEYAEELSASFYKKPIVLDLDGFINIKQEIEPVDVKQKWGLRNIFSSTPKEATLTSGADVEKKHINTENIVSAREVLKQKEETKESEAKKRGRPRIVKESGIDIPDHERPKKTTKSEKENQVEKTLALVSLLVDEIKEPSKISQIVVKIFEIVE
jgi:hypothetical protein